MSNFIKDNTPIQELIKKGERANEHLLALIKARIEIHQMGFDKHGDDGKKGHFKNAYVPIDVIILKCEPILLKHGLLSSCTEVPNSSDPDHKERCRFLLTITYAETMESVSSEITLYADNKNLWGKQSAYTYAKRSLFSSLLSLPTEKNEDDDATGSVENNDPKSLQGRENNTTNKSISKEFK